MTGTFPLPSDAEGLTLGSDGNLWFGSVQTGLFSSITPSAVVASYSPPSPLHVTGQTEGPDGNVWFTDEFSGVVGNISPSGGFKEYVAPNFAPNSGPAAITTGSDGNLWTSETGSGKIARVTATGTITDFYLPPGVDPNYIAESTDGAAWFADSRADVVGRITIDSQVGVATLAPNSFGGSSFPVSLIAGPYGRLWFAEIFPASVAAFSPYVPAPSPPAITQVTPRVGTTVGGQSVDITGYDVGMATQVLFGSTPATSFTVVGPGEVQAVAPPQPGGVVRCRW